jgi:predicted transcriptional regulator
MSAGSTESTPVTTTPEDMLVSDVMTPVAATCSPFSTVTEAVMIFKAQDSDVAPVVDAGKPVGVVVDRDVALAVADVPDLATRPVSEIMVKDWPTVPVDAHVDQALQAMSAVGARLALAVDADGLLVGLVFWSELARRVPLETRPSPIQNDEVPVEVTKP